MHQTTIVSGVIEYASEEAVENILSWLEEEGLIENDVDHYVWSQRMGQVAGEPVVVEELTFVIPALEDAAELAENVDELLDGSEASDIKIARFGENLGITHLQNGEVLIEIDDYDELVEFFQLDTGEYVDDEMALNAHLWDEINVWADEHEDLGE